MKLPKKFNKMSNEEKRKMVAERLKIVIAEQEALTKLSRLLVRDENFTPIEVMGGLDYAKEETTD
jgi:hypothetical protein